MKNTDRSERILTQELPIPAATEEKIQAAYDIVRARSRQRAGNGRANRRGMRPMRKVWAAGLAAALIAVSGLGVMAASGYFTKTVNQEEGNLTYTFDVDYELQPVEVQAVPRYLPEGMKEFEEGSGKYWTEEEYGHGISIFPISTLNLEAQKNMLDFQYVDRVEKTTIQGMEAHIVTYQEAEQHQRGKDVFLFNSDQGYVLWVFGDYNVPLEEVKKVAENLEITVKESSVGYEDMDEEPGKIDPEAQAAADAEFERLADQGVTMDQITKLGETLRLETGNEVTVEKAEVYDSLYEIPGYTEDGVYDMGRLEPWLNSDGTHKPYQRIYYHVNGEKEAEEQMQVKFLMVEAAMKQNIEPSADGTPLNASIVRMEKRADGTWNRIKGDYLPVPSENYYLQIDGGCFYMNAPENLEGSERAHSFFCKRLEQGETVTYTLIFAVDADLVENGQIQNAALHFAAAGDLLNQPEFCALGDLE